MEHSFIRSDLGAIFLGILELHTKHFLVLLWLMLSLAFSKEDIIIIDIENRVGGTVNMMIKRGE